MSARMSDLDARLLARLRARLRAQGYSPGALAFDGEGHVSGQWRLTKKRIAAMMGQAPMKPVTANDRVLRCRALVAQDDGTLARDDSGVTVLVAELMRKRTTQSKEERERLRRLCVRWLNDLAEWIGTVSHQEAWRQFLATEQLRRYLHQRAERPRLRQLRAAMTQRGAAQLFD